MNACRGILTAVVCSLLVMPVAVLAASSPRSCSVEQKCPLIVPTDPARCAELQPKLEGPADFASGGQIQLIATRRSSANGWAATAIGVSLTALTTGRMTPRRAIPVPS